MADFLKDKRTDISKKLWGGQFPALDLPKQSPQEMKESSDDLDEILAPTEWEKERDSMDAGIQKIRQDVMGSNRGIAPEDPMEKYKYMTRLGEEQRGLDFSGGLLGMPKMSKELSDYLLRKFFEDEARRAEEVEESMSDIDRQIRELKKFYGAQ